jgi:hypothetical protein
MARAAYVYLLAGCVAVFVAAAVTAFVVMGAK